MCKSYKNYYFLCRRLHISVSRAIIDLDHKCVAGDEMTFAEKLNEYMFQYNCTPKKLVSLSVVSAATISRYRSGAREPLANSAILEKIADGLYRAAKEENRADISAEQIKRELAAVLSDDSGRYDAESLRLNLNSLIHQLHINTRELCSYLGMDQSKFFRIRTGQSRPSDVFAFCQGVGEFIFSKSDDDTVIDTLSDVLGCTSSELMSEETVCAKITDLLTIPNNSPRFYADRFLRELDGFDTKDYTRDERLTSYRFSSESEKEFVSALEKVDPDSSAIICTDLSDDGTDNNDMMQNLEYIITTLVLRGIHIDLVLNADNPMDEILPGLKNLMPMFMTGNVSAFYLKGRRDGIFRYRLVSLENAALCYEAINGYCDTALIRVASDVEEVKQFRQRAEQIRSLAYPLIEMIDNNDRRISLLESFSQKQGKRASVLSTPPFYTMSESLLDRILKRNHIAHDESERIKKYLRTERARVLDILKHSETVTSYPDIPRDSYDEKPIFLSLSGLFYHREILCTYDEYIEHIKLMKQFENRHPRFHSIADKNSPFRNIQVFMFPGQYLMLSKNKTPTIHLFINHSKLRQAFENMLYAYLESLNDL